MPPVPSENELENATMKAWISDTSGIKEETELEDANAHVQAEEAPNGGSNFAGKSLPACN
jgi:hypothetical protein